MTLSIILDFAAGAMGAVVVVTAAVVTAAWWTRRQWKLFKRRLIVRSRDWALQASEVPMAWLFSTPTISRRSLSLGSTRMRMTRSVASAVHAVEMSKRSGASNGDLESLTRRLVKARTDIDRSLRVAQRSSENGPADRLLVEQAGAVTRSAKQIERAASISMARDHQITTSGLSRDVELEHEAISATALFDTTY